MILASWCVPPWLAADDGTWSGDGHRITCQLAWDRLTPEAVRGVRDLLGPELTASEFADACVWADQIRAQLSTAPAELARFRPFTTAHYVNFPAGAAALSRDGCSSGGGVSVRYCALDGTDYLLDVLDGGTSELSRGEALKFLMHIVGDLHQPLHAGYGEDRGGNDFVVNAVGRSGRNLHWVWDVFMVAHGNEPWPEMARRLDEAISPIQERRWQELDAMEWATESYDIVESHVYRDIEDGGYVGQTYFDRNVQTAERRLQMAGVRLAAVLNDVFGTG